MAGSFVRNQLAAKVVSKLTTVLTVEMRYKELQIIAKLFLSLWEKYLVKL